MVTISIAFAMLSGTRLYYLSKCTISATILYFLNTPYVIRSWTFALKYVIILGMASYSDFLMTCANYFTQAVSLFKIQLLRPLTLKEGRVEMKPHCY